MTREEKISFLQNLLKVEKTTIDLSENEFERAKSEITIQAHELLLRKLEKGEVR